MPIPSSHHNNEQNVERLGKAEVALFPPPVHLRELDDELYPPAAWHSVAHSAPQMVLTVIQLAALVCCRTACVGPLKHHTHTFSALSPVGETSNFYYYYYYQGFTLIWFQSSSGFHTVAEWVQMRNYLIITMVIYNGFLT